mgnify:CR=1 FL=1
MNPNFTRTFQLFFQNGYKAFKIDRDMTAITMKDVDLVSRGGLELNTHNFIFCESKKE